MNSDKVIDACLELSQNQAEGSLFVVETKKSYSKYYKDPIVDIYKKNNKRLSVFSERDKQTIRKLASLDGAVIIGPEGEMLHYGATLLYSQKMMGKGKRHAFALGTSKYVNNAVCILSSEEDKHIRMFKNGACVVEVDGHTKLSVSRRQKIAEFLDLPLTKTLIASGIATSVLTLNPIPAIVMISGSYVVVSEGFGRLKSYFNGK